MFSRIQVPATFNHFKQKAITQFFKHANATTDFDYGSTSDQRAVPSSHDDVPENIQSDMDAGRAKGEAEIQRTAEPLSSAGFSSAVHDPSLGADSTTSRALRSYMWDFLIVLSLALSAYITIFKIEVMYRKRWIIRQYVHKSSSQERKAPASGAGAPEVTIEGAVESTEFEVNVDTDT